MDEKSPCKFSEINQKRYGITCNKEGSYADLALIHSKSGSSNIQRNTVNRHSNFKVKQKLTSTSSNIFSREFRQKLSQEPKKESEKARMRRQVKERQATNKFPPTRILTRDVPPGMKRIRTPFGDRLVPL